ncbi:MAG: hypothetical protein KDK02_06150, partial [Rhodobacteraceae bacterium]|nr:hypothetical protein [Paracoccaceae bacterium]
SIRRLMEAHHGWIFNAAVQSVQVNSIQLMKLLVLSGQFIAATSEVDAAAELHQGMLRFVPINDKDMFQQSFSVISNALIPASATTQKIIAIAVEILEHQVVAGKPAG